jgi:hypothetical protein
MVGEIPVSTYGVHVPTQAIQGRHPSGLFPEHQYSFSRLRLEYEQHGGAYEILLRLYSVL